MAEPRNHSKLPRLPREYYRGHAFVHWEHSIANRTTGWLDREFHFRFRELLSHAGARYGLVTPCYSLMPDHGHLVWIGIHEGSDQLNATAFLRRHLAPLLGEAKLQDRAYDHVLREAQRQHGAFNRHCNYIFENPQRAELVADWRDWPYLGAMFPGYPRLDPREECFWGDFWKLYNRIVDPSLREVPALPRRFASVARPGKGGTRSDGDGAGIPALPRRATDQQGGIESPVARPGRDGTLVAADGREIPAIPRAPRMEPWHSAPRRATDQDRAAEREKS